MPESASRPHIPECLQVSNEVLALIDRLEKVGRLETDEYRQLIEAMTPEAAEYAASLALKKKREVYGNKIYIRGLIEIGNICRNDCLYCGIRRSNKSCERYRLNDDEIVECCKLGDKLGFRTFVLQGGEDAYNTDERLCTLIRRIKSIYPKHAITLSLGERSHESYRLLREAGADRYLLRHETADAAHYEKLHPREMSHARRLECLHELKELGYQVGCGFMVGSPFQSAHELAQDLKFIEEFAPDMCGIGPFIPQKDTPFGNERVGTLELTCYLLSLLRLIRPCMLLPATTALGSIHPYGRERGMLAGANVVMPNLSPQSARKKYTLYDNKVSDGAEAAECVDELAERMRRIGCEIAVARGDAKTM